MESCSYYGSANFTREGFFLHCVCISLLKWELIENADPQISEENAFSPVCVCLFKWELAENED